jgi:hypothetical protein
MSEPTFSKEQVVALEKILGVKLPEQGFTLEIKPIGSGQLDDAQLDGVVGGIILQKGAAAPLHQVGLPELGQFRWSAKI